MTLSLVLATLAAPRLAAQATADLSAASASATASATASGSPAFVDSVRRVNDTAALVRGLEAVKRERGDGADRTSRDRAWRESRQGWLDLRLSELGNGRVRLDEAIAHFDEAIYRDKSLADPWVGLAEAKLLLERRHAVVKASMHQAEGMYYEDAALAHLLTALRAQPTYPAAVALLARLLIEFDAPILPDELVEGLRLAAAQPANGPLPQLLLGRWLRKRGELAPAAAAFRRYAALGGDPGLADLELARVLYRQGQADSAVTRYLAGADRGDTLVRAALRRDLTWFAEPAELRRFDALPRDSVGRWVRNLWAERDAAAVRPAGDRLREHLRRWAYVQEHFGLVGRRKKARFGWGGSGAFGEVTSENEGQGVWALLVPGTLPESDPRALGVDDRGAVYMRHGEPSARASSHAAAPTSAGACGVANESWKYELPTGPILLHFCASEALGMTAPTSLVAMLPLDADILGARTDLDTRFAGLELELQQNALSANLRKHGLGPDRPPRINQVTVQQLATYGHTSLKQALTTDSYALTYAHDLAPTVQIYALGSTTPRAGHALVVFAIPGDRLAPVMREGRLVYPLQLRVTAVDTAQGFARTTDTLRLFAARDTLRTGSYLYGTLDVPLPSGSYYVRLLLEQPARDAAGAVGRPEVAVPGTPGALTLSDLVTGSATSGLAWEHGGRRIALNPLDTYRVGASLELYYEIGGTHPSGRYATTVDMRRLGRGGGRGRDHVSVRFVEAAEGNELAAQRTVGLSELAPGRYLLGITVAEEGSDRRVTRERVINVVPH